MNKRAITWLLAALLALSAGASVPVAGARERGAGSAIVWIARQRSEHKLALAPRHIARERAGFLLGYEPSTQSRQFTPFLYQRPPPSLR